MGVQLIKRTLIACVFLLIFSGIAQAQDISTTVCPGAGCIDIPVGGQGSIGLQITGTWSGTITFRATVDGSNYVTLAVVPSSGGAAVTTTTANGAWTAAIAGFTTVRVVFTAYASGTATITRRTTLAKGPTGGTAGGGGSVTSVGLSMPTGFTVANSPVTTSGTIGVTLSTSNTQVAFNNSGALGGDAGLTYNATSNFITTAYIATGGTPTVDDTSGGDSCGASGNPSMVAGSVDNALSFNVGAGGGTSCRITFSAAAPSRWVCVATNETTSNLVKVTNVDATNVDISGVMVAADVVTAVCFAR